MSAATTFDLPSSVSGTVALTHLQVSCQLQAACYALYCYDHLLVFSDEVEQIWKQRFNFASLLYILNRYATHMLFIAINTGLSPTDWTWRKCDSFTKFRGACTIVGFASKTFPVAQLATASLSSVIQLHRVRTIIHEIPGAIHTDAPLGLALAILILRTYALYGRSAWLLGWLLAVLAAQAILMAICVGTANARIVDHQGCVAVGTVSYYGALWIAPLGTDTLILVAILLLMRAYRRAQLDVPMAQQICRDGISYYLVILSANMLGLVACCAWTVGKPDAVSALLWSDLTTIGTPFAQVITSLMVARLQLDLRARQSTLPERNARPPPFFALANLGGD